MTQRTAMTVISLGCAALLLGGCAQPRQLTDEGFGDAVRAAQAQQTLNPDASRNRAAPKGLDGPAAKASVDRYEKSYEAPPPPVNVFTIGIGSGGGSSQR